ncbi:MAG: laccase domain-containing protein [Helicobacter sp.]|nr:laccase domain-containing protein [Helicobacter sp.]
MSDYSVSVFYTSAQSSLFSSFPIDFIQTCALGGVSKASFTGCNIAYHTGDVPDSVATNREQILRYFDGKQLLWCDQIHSAHIADATDLYVVHRLTKGVIQADGILCADTSYVALIMVADCNPILLYDPKCNVFALLHAGRAGVCKRILTQATQALKAKGSKPSDLLVFIGSSIRACCYEIDSSLCEQIANDFDERYIHIHNGSNMLDLIAMLRDECSTLGIKDEHLEILDSCTACDERLFSHRRASKKHMQTGRFGLLASLR